MDSWSRSREIEKPKPIKLQAAGAATLLIQTRDAMKHLDGENSWAYHNITKAIAVLQIVAGEKKP